MVEEFGSSWRYNQDLTEFKESGLQLMKSWCNRMMAALRDKFKNAEVLKDNLFLVQEWPISALRRTNRYFWEAGLVKQGACDRALV